MEQNCRLIRNLLICSWPVSLDYKIPGDLIFGVMYWKAADKDGLRIYTMSVLSPFQHYTEVKHYINHLNNVGLQWCVNISMLQNSFGLTQYYFILKIAISRKSDHFWVTKKLFFCQTTAACATYSSFLIYAFCLPYHTFVRASVKLGSERFKYLWTQGLRRRASFIGAQSKKRSAEPIFD